MVAKLGRVDPCCLMTEAAPSLGMTLSELDAYLAPKIDGFGALKSVVKFETGQSNPTYRLTTNAGEYVLRSKPPGKLLPSAHAVDREYHILCALAGGAVPVPKALHLAQPDVSPNGRMFYVMSYVPGKIFWDPALPNLRATDRGVIYEAMAASLAAVHKVDLGTAELASFGKPGNYFTRQLERWQAQYLSSVTMPDPLMSKIFKWLEDEMLEDDGQLSLVHGDWRIDNMIFDPQSFELKAILDWELSTIGHPMADLAYQCMQWRLPNQGEMRGLSGIDRTALGIPSEADYLASYAAKRGLGPIENWTFYLVFAFFRLSAILAGVAARAEAGNASNPEMARKYGAAVPVLAKMAVQIIDEGAGL